MRRKSLMFEKQTSHSPTIRGHCGIYCLWNVNWSIAFTQNFFVFIRMEKAHIYEICNKIFSHSYCLIVHLCIHIKDKTHILSVQSSLLQHQCTFVDGFSTD
ncbi:UNVERIFIED_CONTAM: hypothetical protein NCL1_56798 [Trichonephila clavipes]